jgi:ATP-dependent DNA ligase
MATSIPMPARKTKTTKRKSRRGQGHAALPLPADFHTMEARLTADLPEEPGWQYEPKWDGFRCLAWRAGDGVELQGRSGKALTRFFPEVAARLARLEARHFILDGELVIPAGDTLSFDALQMRLHPAESRIKKLAAETPATFITFDLLADAAGESLLDAPLIERRAALEAFHAVVGEHAGLRLSPYTRDVRLAQRWLDLAGGALDGVVAKRLDGRYAPGERAMLKVKRLRTADCVVGGFRFGHNSREVASLLLGLYNDAGQLDHVGFTSAIAQRERAALTRRLKPLIAPPGFTGKAPGGPSRWSTERSGEWQPLRPELVVEVRYDQVTGDRFRHGTMLLRWRPDKAPEQCRFDQLQREARPTELINEILER